MWPYLNNDELLLQFPNDLTVDLSHEVGRLKTRGRTGKRKNNSKEI